MKRVAGFFVTGAIRLVFPRAGALRRAEGGAAAALTALAAAGFGFAVGSVEEEGRFELARKGLPIDRGSLPLLA